ncbi:MAG: DinB family protein [Candidatus Odinarchaeota archaeon]
MLVNHNITCREPILKTLENLTSEDLTKDLGIGKSSIRDILVHLMNSEKYWISLLSNAKFEHLDPRDFTDISSIRTAWCEIESGTIDFIKSLQENDLLHVRSVMWKKGTMSFTVGKALIHMATHETHHRGLIVGLIRQMGFEPPDVNML